MPSLAAVRLSDDRRRVLLAWADGAATEASAAWLLDNADEALDPVNGQRLHGALALAENRTLEDAALQGEVVRLRFAPTGTVRAIGARALRSAASRPGDLTELWLTPQPIAATAPIDFGAYLHDDGAQREALSRVARHGVAFLCNAGIAAGTVERAVRRFGYIRETNYGRLFEVREAARPSNLAYTARGLDLHTDNPYRDPPPTLQLLHAITVAPEGGENQFVDGFAHAMAFARETPEAFRILCEYPVAFRYTGPDGERFDSHAPIIETDRAGAPRIIRLNHRSLRTAELDPCASDAWYEAYLAFYRRLHAPEARYERGLTSGDIVIFDNWRVLHGRSAYQGGTAPRWLQGCYADRDGLLATLSRLEHET